MNSDLIVKSLCFHGQPLQKIWEGERGNHDLPRLGIANPDYSVYMARQKNLTFQDRAKRLKLHQFVARNASILFDSKLIEDMPSAKRREKPNGKKKKVLFHLSYTIKIYLSVSGCDATI